MTKIGKWLHFPDPQPSVAHIRNNIPHVTGLLWVSVRQMNKSVQPRANSFLCKLELIKWLSLYLFLSYSRFPFHSISLECSNWNRNKNIKENANESDSVWDNGRRQIRNLYSVFGFCAKNKCLMISRMEVNQAVCPYPPWKLGLNLLREPRLSM